MRRIAILGWEEGLAGQVSTWVEGALGAELVCFVHPSDDFPEIDPVRAMDRPSTRFSYPQDGLYLGKRLIIGSTWADSLAELGIEAVVCCLADPNERRTALEEGQSKGVTFLSAIHPSAQCLSESSIGLGVIVEPNCYVGYKAEVGACTHLHAGSQVDHHSVIGAYVTLNPGVLIAGNVRIGDGSTVNMGAIISNRVELGNRTIVGAGSIVLKSFRAPDLLIIGTPAKLR